MDLRHIARLLGGTVSGPNQIVCPGPGHTRPDRSLSVTFVGADEPIVHSFAGDDWRACKDHVARLLGLPEWRPSQDFEEQRRRQEAKRTLRAKTEAETEAKNTRVARLIWNRGVDPRGTAAELYLKSRGLTLTDEACARFDSTRPLHGMSTLTIRTIRPGGIRPCSRPSVPSRPTRSPASIVSASTGRACGRKTRRMMLGPVAGSAVKLADVPDGVLAVGEGIETCMAANALGFGPAWALGSAGAIATLPVLEDIRKLILLGENDDASRKATDDCAQRWLRAGREVELVEPEVGKDLNDELMGSR